VPLATQSLQHSTFTCLGAIAKNKIIDPEQQEGKAATTSYLRHISIPRHAGDGKLRSAAQRIVDIYNVFDGEDTDPRACGSNGRTSMPIFFCSLFAAGYCFAALALSGNAAVALWLRLPSTFGPLTTFVPAEVEKSAHQFSVAFAGRTR